MFTEKLFYSLPYSTRRTLFAKIKRREFNNLQNQRTFETDSDYSFKPFDQYKCIFVHIPRTGGVSICKSLFNNLAGGHATLPKYQIVFSENDFNRYFKFSFIRNPWDRLFSAYNFLKRGGMNERDKRWAKANISSYKNFEHFVTNGLPKSNIQQYIHFKSQSSFLFIPGDKRLNIDFLGFFENLHNDFRYMVNKLGLSERITLKHENESNQGNIKNYRDFYTEETLNIVASIYRNDIDNFGYNFDNSSLETQLQNRRSDNKNIQP